MNIYYHSMHVRIILQKHQLINLTGNTVDQYSRKRVQQLKKRKMSRFLDFQKNVKNVRTLWETNPTEQCLAVQINNYTLAFGNHSRHARAAAGNSTTELDISYSPLGEVANLVWRIEDQTSLVGV